MMPIGCCSITDKIDLSLFVLFLFYSVATSTFTSDDGKTGPSEFPDRDSTGFYVEPSEIISYLSGVDQKRHENDPKDIPSGIWLGPLYRVGNGNQKGESTKPPFGLYWDKPTPDKFTLSKCMAIAYLVRQVVVTDRSAGVKMKHAWMDIVCACENIRYKDRLHPEIIPDGINAVSWTVCEQSARMRNEIENTNIYTCDCKLPNGPLPIVGSFSLNPGVKHISDILNQRVQLNITDNGQMDGKPVKAGECLNPATTENCSPCPAVSGNLDPGNCPACPEIPDAVPCPPFRKLPCPDCSDRASFTDKQSKKSRLSGERNDPQCPVGASSGVVVGVAFATFVSGIAIAVAVLIILHDHLTVDSDFPFIHWQ